jgi:heme exporter protein C
MLRRIWLFRNWFGVAAGLLIAPGLYIGLAVSPPDYYQGEVVRIMYVHVPFAQSALLAYVTLTVFSIWYLWKRDPLVDNMAHASAGVGTFFTLGALITGSIWAKPTWNVWWTWDARLTSFAVLFLIYVGYLMLRRFIDEKTKEARYAAILAIVGGVDLPIIHWSVDLWRTLHQPQSFKVSMEEGVKVSMTNDILLPLMLMSTGVSLLLIYMIMVRTQVLYLDQLLEAKKGRLLTRVNL